MVCHSDKRIDGLGLEEFLLERNVVELKALCPKLRIGWPYAGLLSITHKYVPSLLEITWHACD